MPTSTEQTILVRNNGKFFCGLFYHKRIESWKIYFDLFNVKNPNDDFVLERFHQTDNQLEAFILNSYGELMYEIRKKIIQTCLLEENELLMSILEHVKEHLGEIVDFNGKQFLLVGVSASLEDYYYYGIDSNLELVFHSCVGKFDVLGRDQLDRSDRSDHLNDPNLDEIILKLRMEHFPNSEEVELIHI